MDDLKISPIISAMASCSTMIATAAAGVSVKVGEAYGRNRIDGTGSREAKEAIEIIERLIYRANVCRAELEAFIAEGENTDG